MTSSKICQSCAMPMAKDADLGTNSDGSRNGEYCHFCFENGQFKDPGLTLDKQIDKMIKMSAKMGMSESDAKNMASATLPTLKRWS